MKTARVFVTLITVVAIMGTITPTMADHQYDVMRPVLGGVLGGVLGSVLGNNIGKGSTTRRVATGLGAALGLLAGREFARYEHLRNVPVGVPVPHVLQVPPLRIHHNPMALTCKIIDYSKQVYACQEQSGR
ncbi:MAG: glycine zipper 2TM domain-containing protein [Nitrospira sp.]|nr:glycine zipper 2TM domain-containing protein [Nitrospira sp.]